MKTTASILLAVAILVFAPSVRCESKVLNAVSNLGDKAETAVGNVGNAGKDVLDQGKAEAERLKERATAETKALKARNELGDVTSKGKNAAKKLREQAEAQLQEAERSLSGGDQFRVLGEAATSLARTIHADLQSISIPDELKKSGALIDWAQIQAYILAVREFGPRAQRTSQVGQARYIKFVDEWLTQHGHQIQRGSEGDMKAAGVPVLPEGVKSEPLDELARKAATLASPAYPWHSEPNGAGSHQFKVSDRLVVSKGDLAAACRQHDKDFQSPGISVDMANDRLEKELKRIYFQAYREMESFLK